jgi:predicted acylesterase/phospholipase RssA
MSDASQRRCAVPEPDSLLSRADRPADPTGEDAPSPRQLRLALSMNGGVSLAVWIGGAVCEIDQLRSGTGTWGDLLEATGHDRRAMVDVMAGASAGGLNAVMLAQSLRADSPFGRFLTLWQQHADIDLLLQPPSTAGATEPRGVLSGRYFFDRLHDALVDPGPAVATHDLAVFASATLVSARPVAYTDVPGKPIDESRSDAYFHVARRGAVERGLDGFAPPTAPSVDNVTALATIGRATSSLPGLFEPVPIRRSRFGPRLVGAFDRRHVQHDAPVEIMDGGVIDNVPIARAIRAIASSAADHRVHRVLLYLHPDPSGPVATMVPRTALAVVQAFRGKRSESIREDIELLRQHNDAVDRRQGAATALLRGLLGAPAPEMGDTGARSLAASSARAMLLRAAIDPGSELPWHAPGVARVTPLLDGNGDPSRAWLAAQLDTVVEDPSLLAAARIRRSVLAVQRLVRSVEAADRSMSFGPSKAALYEVLLLADLMHAYQLARFVGHGDDLSGDGPVARLVASRAELAAIRLPADGPDDLTWRALASWDTSEFRHHGDVGLLDHLEHRLSSIVASLPVPAGDAIDRHEDALVAASVLRRLVDGSLPIGDLERALLPLAAEPVASDQRIAFVRATGDVASPAATAFAAAAGPRQPKVAGVQLHHLGAFFDLDWRTNDWWWGRLDTVRAVVDSVLDDEALDALRTNGFLADRNIDPAADAATIADALVETRQLELLNEWSGRQDVSLAAATQQAGFGAWAASNRRFSGLVGTRRLTSTAIRGALTAWRVMTAPMSRTRRVLLSPMRSAVLALIGVLLAGRRAAATLAWTLCVMSAPRASSPTGRWVTWLVGLVLVAVVTWVVERKVKPTVPAHSSALAAWFPTVVAVAGLVSGAIMVIGHDRWADESWWWTLPVIAAIISAWMLFFWMAGWARRAFCVLTAALYGAWAWNAYDWAQGRSSSVLDWWPVRTMWVCWFVAVIGMPMLIARLPDRWLRPDE